MASPGTYGFQRGNLMFTSTPPSRSLIPVRSNTIPRSAYSRPVQHAQQQLVLPRPSQTNYSDSGYNSEQLSSQTHSSLSSRQPSDKRCKSTYSIVLASATSRSTITGPYVHQHPQSKIPFPRPWSSYYQQHQAAHHRQQNISPCCRYSTVPEVCEDCVEATGGSTQFTTHFCTRLTDKTAASGLGISKKVTTGISKDAASQTTDIEAQQSPVAARRKVRRKTTGALSGSSGRDELKSNNVSSLEVTGGFEN